MPKKVKKAIIFCGSRDWKDKKAIEAGFDKFQPDLVLVGGAKGADDLSLEVCQDRSVRFKLFEADWNQFGRAAGVFRNEEMLNHLLKLEKLGWEVSIVGYPKPTGRGTQNMIFQGLLQNARCYTYKRVLEFQITVKGEKRVLKSIGFH